MAIKQSISVTITHVTIIFQHMVIVANADAVILSIMQQEYHYDQKVTHLLGFMYRPSLCYNRREKGRHL